MAEDQKKHVDYHRKVALRKALIEKAGELPGAFYVPFVGDGDIAADLYKEHKIYGADLDPARVATSKSRLTGAEILEADCDSFPFKGQVMEYSLADFDSYSYPYKSFREFWKDAKLRSPCVLFFTDGQRQAIQRSGHWTDPAGKKRHDKTLKEKRQSASLYFTKVVLPWFTDFIKPWQIVEVSKYLCGPNMVYWGAIISLADGEKQVYKTVAKGENHKKFDDIKKGIYLEALRNGASRTVAARKAGIHPATVSIHISRDKAFSDEASLAETEADGKVVNALFEAAQSGNVTAIQVWLYNRQPDHWKDKRNTVITGPGGGPLQHQMKAAEEMTDEELDAAIAKVAAKKHRVDERSRGARGVRGNIKREKKKKAS
jgi:hypothetical protein